MRFVTTIRKLVLTLMLGLGLAGVALAQVPEELPFAKKLKLAQVGDDEAQMAVGLAYENGVDTKPDKAEAAKWYRKAALAGNLDAQFRLAGLVAKGSKGLTRDMAVAVKLYQTAADKGHAASQNALGQLHQAGNGVAKDDKLAFEWYEKAAAQRLAVAENNLGMMYLNGTGTARNLAQAFQLFERAAEQNDGWGLNNLGGMYEMGWGVARSPLKARDYYARAAALGIESASANLARLGDAATGSVKPVPPPPSAVATPPTPVSAPPGQ